MNRILEQIYYRSPAIIQNIALSAYGRVLQNRRHGGKFPEYVRHLLETQHFSEEGMRRLQMRELTGILRHAFTHVPYYRELSRSTGISADDIREVSDLHELPIVDKERIRSEPLSFRAHGFAARGKTFTLETSGTSGKPLIIYCDKESRRRNYAFMERLRSWFGVEPGMRRATFFARVLLHPERSRPPFWRYDAFGKNHLFSYYHMSEPNLKHYHDKLRRIRPDEITGYPSNLYILARYMKRNGLGGVRPRAVFTTAETLLDYQRDAIEEAFEREVVDQYGCAEMAVFISQCEKGTYHVHPEYGIVEVVGRDGKPVADGGQGEVVCTSFINFAMPMIRYRLGDMLKLGSKRCACGRNFPVVEKILGRVDDMLYTPDGRPLGGLDAIFKGSSGIRETQIIQTAPDRLVFRIVADTDFTEESREDLLREIRKRTGGEMKIEIRLVGGIEKDASGKFRAVKSNLKTDEFGHS